MSDTPKEHDGQCELYGGWHSCKCWLRQRGRHPAMFMLDEWREEQHPLDRAAVDTLMEQMNEALHRVDYEQEKLATRTKPKP